MNSKGLILSPAASPRARRLFSKCGFTLVELTVILGIIGVLAGLLIPALGKAKTLAQRTACLSNLRQLGLSWVLYSSDNDGRLVESYPGTSATPNPYAWVLGNMQNPAEASNPALIMRGQLFQYNNSTAIYHCPADQALPPSPKAGPPVRSYSMNAFMGDSSRFGSPALQGDAALASQYEAFYAKDSDINQPSALWVLIDEDNRTIGDGFFTLDPTGRQRPTHYPAATVQRHNFGFGMLFADGHSEIWRLSEPLSPLLNANSLVATAGANKDFKKLGLATATSKQK
jgi:prepilin-type processing-associated H-X9-DG protein